MAIKLIEIEAARGLVLDHVTKPLEAERVPLGDALGRVLAEDLNATEPVPASDNSAMDGYAVRAADTAEAPATLRTAGESRAGTPADRPLGDGEAIAISTGALVPEGADAVVRVEDTESAYGSVVVSAAVELGQNIRRAGEDIRVGERVLAAGTTVGPAEIGVLGSLGSGEVPCARRPLVSVLSTGDELIGFDEPLHLGAVRNSNSLSVPALALAAGAEVALVERVRDDPAATREAIERGLEGDVLVVCGGVSVGEHDHVRPALADLGAEQAFWGVALRPGKPTWFGVTPGGALVFGLPGNPVSAMVTFILFARPAIRALLGADPAAARTRAILDEDLPKKPGRTHAVRCSLELREDGWHARSTGAQGSHVLTSMLGADALAFLPSESDGASAGDRVEIELLPGHLALGA
ncbi:MAG: molybdopterin molybdenumtransferase MoeA [Solirubrobacterales bacterium]|nr:molybdopterin molybdenumtransferase MoeA [Solirubrobacterales bacterium]